MKGLMTHFPLLTVYITRMYGAISIPLSLIQLVHGYKKSISTLITPFVTTSSRRYLTKRRSSNPSLTLYLYFARKAFWLFEPLLLADMFGSEVTIPIHVSVRTVRGPQRTLFVHIRLSNQLCITGTLWNLAA